MRLTLAEAAMPNNFERNGLFLRRRCFSDVSASRLPGSL